MMLYAMFFFLVDGRSYLDASVRAICPCVSPNTSR
jgi:hypothetical protein